MMQTTEDTITFSRNTWEELRNDSFFQELIEIIEDREHLEEAKNSTEYFVDLEDYHQQRISKSNV